MGPEAPLPGPTVLLVDDHARMRAGLRFILEAKTELVVVGEAADGEKAVALCREVRPDVVLMDITMPKMGGIEATRLIKAERPETAVLVLTSHVAEDLERRLQERQEAAQAAEEASEGYEPRSDAGGPQTATEGGQAPRSLWARIFGGR